MSSGISIPSARRTDWFLAVLAALVSVVGSLLVAGPASAATPAFGYDAVTYTYDVPARSSSPSAAVPYVRGPRAGPEVASWERSASTRGCCVAAEGAGDGVSLSLKYKDGWTAAQRAAADAKVAALNDADLSVTAVQRAGTSAASRYRSAGGVIPRGADVDHMIDLQLGGADDILNMNPLDYSVNRSLGAQIANQIRGLEPGTRICSVSICAR
jgi:hypothetical protein